MAANDNVVTCANSQETFLELLARATGVDATGKKYLRLYATTNVAGSKGFACGGLPTDEESIANGFRTLFAFDANGDVALRTGTA